VISFFLKITKNKKNEIKMSDSMQITETSDKTNQQKPPKNVENVELINKLVSNMSFKKVATNEEIINSTQSSDNKFKIVSLYMMSVIDCITSNNFDAIHVIQKKFNQDLLQYYVKDGRELMIVQIIRSFLLFQQIQQKLVNLIQNYHQHPDQTLTTYMSNWTYYYKCILTITSFIKPISENLITSSTVTYNVSVYSVFLKLWYEGFVAHHKESLFQQFIYNITHGGHKVIEFKSYIDSLTIISRDVPEYLETSFSSYFIKYIQRSTNELCVECGGRVTEVSEKAVAMISHERFVCKQFYPFIYDRVDSVLMNVLITKNLDLLRGAFLPSIENDEKLCKNIVFLLSCVNEWGNLGQDFQNYTVTFFQQKLQALKEQYETTSVPTTSASSTKKPNSNVVPPHEIIGACIDVYHHFQTILKVISVPLFQSNFDIAFVKVFNTNCFVASPAKISEILAFYCDIVLRKVVKIEPEKGIENMNILFRYLSEKDVFQTFHTKFMSRRLLNNTSSADEHEELIINHLKNHIGIEYITKFTKMITDMALSKELSDSFLETHPSTKTLSKINVLSTFAWNLNNPEVKFVIPSEIATDYNTFASFYRNKFPNRKLSWMFNESRCDVVTTFLKQTFTLNLHIHQLALLLLFNTHLSIKVDHTLSELLGLTAVGLKNIYETLVQVGILLFNSSTEEISLNTKFTNPKLKIIVPQHTTTVQKSENDKTHAQALEERKILIQAVIVRIMKSRKTLSLNDLMQETIESLKLRFKPEVSLIKFTIEQLIDKEYLERDGADRNVFHYIS
jgi:hypothetical protein